MNRRNPHLSRRANRRTVRNAIVSSAWQRLQAPAELHLDQSPGNSLGRLNGVLHQHRYRHRPDPSRYRRNVRRNGECLLVLYVSHQPLATLLRRVCERSCEGESRKRKGKLLERTAVACARMRAWLEPTPFADFFANNLRLRYVVK